MRISSTSWALLFCFLLSAWEIRGGVCRADGTSTDAPEERGIEVEVTDFRFYLPNPALIFDSPAATLESNPLIDVQTRGQAVAQGDISIRGGTFDNSGIVIAGMPLFDPQTGHYLAELPVSSAMLSAPEILSGIESTLTGMNAVAGQLAYQWRPIVSSSTSVGSAIGDFRTNTQTAYWQQAGLFPGLEHLNADLDVSRAESDGTRPHGDYNLSRAAGRLQWLDDCSQSDLFAGYQEKEFNWPYLYVPEQIHQAVGSSGIEGETLHTSLLAASHRQTYGEQSYVQGAAYLRRNADDYDFDHFAPDLFNPFRHQSRSRGISLSGKHVQDSLQLEYTAHYAADHMRSTALLAGDFMSREYWHASVLPGKNFEISPATNGLLRLGASLDDTNRDRSRISPLASFSIEEQRAGYGTNQYYLDLSQASQVAGYTAIASSPSAGLFRGNQDLARTISTNYEAGWRVKRDHYELQSAVFVRYDRDLVDWTFSTSAPLAARSANNLDVTTSGFENSLQVDFESHQAVVGYTYLNKVSDLGDINADASFYALNYPRQRISLAWLSTLGEQISLRLDSEYRLQVPNVLRDSGDRSYLISSAAIIWTVPWQKGLQLSVSVDNLGAENFEEVPGVPGTGRLAVVNARLTW